MAYLILEFGRYIYPARAVGFILSGFLVGQEFIAGAVCASNVARKFPSSEARVMDKGLNCTLRLLSRVTIT